MKWYEQDTLKFVELYHDHDCLWNMTCETYKNKEMREKAVEAIIREMNKDGFGIPEVKQKIKNIRSTYNQEKQKIERSQTTECSSKNVYKPSVKWFDTMDKIMKCSKFSNKSHINLVSNIN